MNPAQHCICGLQAYGTHLFISCGLALAAALAVQLGALQAAGGG